MQVNGLPIPEELLALLYAGHWPKNEDEARMQNLRSPISQDLIKRIAADESMLFLYPPPFCTLASLQKSGEEFWQTPIARPDEIVATHCIPIGDFGLGSDAPIMLDYRHNEENPSVIRLQWAKGGSDNHWIKVGSNFKEFSDQLELWAVDFTEK